MDFGLNEESLLRYRRDLGDRVNPALRRISLSLFLSVSLCPSNNQAQVRPRDPSGTQKVNLRSRPCMFEEIRFVMVATRQVPEP